MGCRQEAPAVRQVFERFAADGFEVVYVGVFETGESCRAWKEEYELAFPVINDEEGALFRVYTNGWVPWSVLVGPDGRVVFSENEFDEAGFSKAIQQMYERPAAGKPVRRRAGSDAASVVVLGGGTGGLVAARELRRRLPERHRVVVLDRSPDHVYQPSLLWQIVGERRQDQVERSAS
ncbi:MAG: peroxiredoxin family protein [Gaiellales bacterium]